MRETCQQRSIAFLGRPQAWQPHLWVTPPTGQLGSTESEALSHSPPQAPSQSFSPFPRFKPSKQDARSHLAPVPDGSSVSSPFSAPSISLSVLPSPHTSCIVGWTVSPQKTFWSPPPTPPTTGNSLWAGTSFPAQVPPHGSSRWREWVFPKTFQFSLHSKYLG